MNFFHEKLYGRRALMLVLLNRIADAERSTRMNMGITLGTVENYTVHYFSTGTVNQFKFYMFVMPADKFRSSKVRDSACTEHRLTVARSKRIELP